MSIPNLIGVIGLNGSGKSTLCKILQKKDYFPISLSDVVRQHNLTLDIPIDRDNLTHQANELKKKFGIDHFAKKTYSIITQKKISKVIFDSIRHPAEMEYLKLKNTYFIGVNASSKIRFKRIKARQRETDFIDYETFKKQENYETTGKSFGQHINKCFKLCDTLLNNENSEEELIAQIDFLFKRLAQT